MRMEKLNERFIRVKKIDKKWEMKIKEDVRCWNNLRENESVISEWMKKEEKMIDEKKMEKKKNVE